MFSDYGIDFQTARQVNNKLKEPRRLKKDPMAQTSINAFFTKQDKRDGGPKNIAAHNGAGKSSAEPLVRIKSEKVSEDEVSDAETVIDFAAIPPKKVKDEPLDANDAPENGTIVPKKEPECFPPSDEDTDVEMDIDPTLANDLDPKVNIKTEPVPAQNMVESILSGVFAQENTSNAPGVPSNARLDDVNRLDVKKEPEEYPPSDEETDEEMDIDPAMATALDPAIKVKIESTPLEENARDKVAWILRQLEVNESAAQSEAPATTAKTTSESIRAPVLKEKPGENPPSHKATDEEMEIDPTLVPQLDPAVKVKIESTCLESPEEDLVASILRGLPSEVKETDSDAQSEVLPSTSSSILPLAKRKPDNYLEKDSGKKQKVSATSRREPIWPSSSVANEDRARKADSNEVFNLQNLLSLPIFDI